MKRKKSAKRPIPVMRGSEKTDPQGSYTGKPKDKGEKPVQDADDL